MRSPGPSIVLFAVLVSAAAPVDSEAGTAQRGAITRQRAAPRRGLTRSKSPGRLTRPGGQPGSAGSRSLRRAVIRATSLGRRTTLARPEQRTGARSPSDAARRQRATLKTLIDAGVEPDRLHEVLEHVSLGMPSRASVRKQDDFVVAQPGYVSSYSRSRKSPNWVAAKLTRSDVTGKYSKRLRFKRNPKIPDAWEPASQNDYKGEFARRRITRGHLIGSGDQTADPGSHGETYFLQTNVVPQIYENNAGPWHDFETYLRNQARGRKDVYVFAGGIYGKRPARMGLHRVPIPKATWKVAVVVEPGQAFDSPTTKVMYLMVPNKVGKVRLNQTFESFLIDGPEMERQTGLRFFTSQTEPVRQQLLEQRYRPDVPVHYFSRRKLGEIRQMGLAIPDNVRMDPADLHFRERVALALRKTGGAIARFFRRGRGASGPVTPPPADRFFQPVR
jgi:endonuclease G